MSYNQINTLLERFSAASVDDETQETAAVSRVTYGLAYTGELEEQGSRYAKLLDEVHDLLNEAEAPKDGTPLERLRATMVTAEQLARAMQCSNPSWTTRVLEGTGDRPWAVLIIAVARDGALHPVSMVAARAGVLRVEVILALRTPIGAPPTGRSTIRIDDVLMEYEANMYPAAIAVWPALASAHSARQFAEHLQGLSDSDWHRHMSGGAAVGEA